MAFDWRGELTWGIIREEWERGANVPAGKSCRAVDRYLVVRYLVIRCLGVRNKFLSGFIFFKVVGPTREESNPEALTSRGGQLFLDLCRLMSVCRWSYPAHGFPGFQGAARMIQIKHRQTGAILLQFDNEEAYQACKLSGSITSCQFVRTRPDRL